MALLNTLLQDICKKAFKDSHEKVWNFALSSRQALHTFYDILATVKSVELRHDGAILKFDWGQHDVEFYHAHAKSVISYCLNYTPELIVSTADVLQLELVRQWKNYDNICSIRLADISEDCAQESLLAEILKIPVNSFSADARAIIPFITTMENRQYENFEVIFENGYFDNLETMLSNYRIHSKNTKFLFTGEYTWNEILYVFSKIVQDQDYQTPISSIVENLTMYFDGDIDAPHTNPPAFDLTAFFEDLQRAFPNVKKVDFCIDFTNISDNLVMPEDIEPQAFLNLKDSLVEQIRLAAVNYDLQVTWIREDHVIDASEEGVVFSSLAEALGQSLGFNQIEKHSDSCTWEMVDSVAPNKQLKMRVTLIEPRYDLYHELYQDMMEDVGLFDDGDDYYDEFEDAEAEAYDEYGFDEHDEY